MKRTAFLILSTMLSASAFCQNFSWAESWGGTSYDQAYSVITDEDGNIYTAGSFQKKVDFDPGPGEVNLTALELDCFITKTDPQGRLLWVKQLGGDGNDELSSIILDNEGNIYSSGLFSGDVDFDPGTGTFMMNSNNDGRTFIWKLDPDGNFIWAKQFGGSSNTVSLAIDPDNNIYSIGVFSHLADFDPGVGVANLDGGNGRSIFISKFDGDGNYVWAKHFLNYSDTSYLYASAVAVDNDGNVYFTGGFEDTVDFDPGIATQELVPGSMNIYLGKLDLDGNLLWVNHFGSTDFDNGTALALDGDANIYAVGSFSGEVDFDPGTGTSTLTSDYYNGPASWYSPNLYISKYDTDGNFVWVKGIIGPGEVSGNTLKLDADGDIYIAGHFNRSIDLDPGIGGNIVTTTGPANWGNDIFVVKLEANGDYLWGKTVGGDYHDRAYGMAVDLSENVYLTGIFEDTVDFDPGTPTWELHSVTTFSGTPDVFLMKLSSCVPSVSSQTVTGQCNVSYTWPSSNLVYDTTGIYHYITTNMDGCDSIITLNLNIPFIEAEAIFDIDGTLTYDDPTADAYQWIYCNSNDEIEGETSPTFTPTENGMYALRITKGNCVFTSSCVNINYLGVNELDALNISFYPNPAHDKLTIKMDDENQVLVIEVTNIGGQEIFATQAVKSGDSLPVHNWETGVYFIKTTSGRGSYMFKVVKH